MQPHWNVFISSTSIDLPEYRSAVRDAILSLGFFPSGMETWPVSGENPVALCKNWVEKADIYLGIYAHRYGWRPDPAGPSITEMEYDWAEGIPRLCFIMRDDHPWPKDKMELDAEADLKRFKTKVKANQVGFFSTPDNLKAQVTAALANIKAAMRAADTITWEPGASFDNYTLRELLGTGGNGQVWLADQRLPDGTSRPVAIKVLKAGISEDPVRVERFKREIGNMARIDHAHIVPVYDYEDRGGQLYVIMPYFGGGTLRSRLTGTPLPEETALGWLEQIGAALDYVHDRHHELIHRDVKPENILIGADGETLHLADFGLVFSAGGDERLTDDGKPVGTGRYMAPEQWQGKPLSRRTDLYALGILAYELLTGHLPFQHKNDLELGNAHCCADLPADRHLADEVLRILSKAAAKDPADRYPTARAFLSDLRNWRIDPANIEPRIQDYLKWVTDELYDELRAHFVELAGDQTLRRLAPPGTAHPLWEDADDLFARASAAINADHVSPKDESNPAFVENVRDRLLTLDRAMLIGEPGSGKTWMLQRLQADYARAWLKGSGGRRLIPVLVRLNKYTGGTFTNFVKAALDTLDTYHDQLLREKRLVLLCDALNEMPRGNGQLHELVEYLKHAPYFVVSCRVRDYSEDDLTDLKPLEQVLLRDLELPAIRELVHKRLPDGMGASLWQRMGGTEALFIFWEKVQVANESERFWDAKTKWGRLSKSLYPPDDWYAMHSGARLIPLARNPYMSDLLCRTCEASAGTLPDSRAELFGQFIEQMLSREARTAARRGDPFLEPNAIQAALVALARALQAAKRTVISAADALKAVERPDAAALLRAATDANILSAQGDELRFAHQLLQEYFAAKILLEKMAADEAEHSHRRVAELFDSAWWDAGVWRETLVILGEFLGGARGANQAARWLAGISPETALDVIERNGAGLTLDDVELETRQALVAGATSCTTEPDPRGRAAAYRVLGRLEADDRKGVSVDEDNYLPDIDWVPVEAGQFLIGNEKLLVVLPYTYWIARYPVTYAQYMAFAEGPEGGYTTDDYWTADGLKWREEKHQLQSFWYDREWRSLNHPVVRVTWHEAVAFCRWLTEKLRSSGQSPLPTEWEVGLPNEAEWEKAARGSDGRVYPWGDEYISGYANLNETYGEAGPYYLHRTTPVGMYPLGKSPYGVMDLCGNVWEWCATKSGWKYEDGLGAMDNSLEGYDVRVVRGGSWNSFPRVARSAARSSNLPGLRHDSQGFRVACRLPFP